MNSNKIAVVDENPDTVRALVRAFTAAGYEASGAVDFKEAVALLGGCRPALIVVNAEPGPSNGLHLALRAVADAPETKIIVLGPASAGFQGAAHPLAAS
jgi:DNA-binding response OmpR family regulator